MQQTSKLLAILSCVISFICLAASIFMAIVLKDLVSYIFTAFFGVATVALIVIAIRICRTT